MEKHPPINPFLWAYQYDQAQCVKIDTDAVKLNHTKQHYQWVHLQFDAEETPRVLEGYGVNAAVIDALTAEQTRPRVDFVNQGVLMILRGINNNQDAEPEDMISVRIWFNDRFIVSTHLYEQPLKFIETVRQQCEGTDWPATVGGLVTQMIEGMVDDIGETLEAIELAIGDIESEEVMHAYDVRHKRLVQLRRQIAALRRYLAPQRDAMSELNQVSMFTQSEAFDLKLHADRIFRYVEDLDLARERVIFLQEELRNQISEQQNQRVYVLSMVTAIFLPLSFLTSLFGVNLGGMPGADNADAFLYLCLGMGLIAFLVGIAMLIKRWL